jgi:hypothetical protein
MARPKISERLVFAGVIMSVVAFGMGFAVAAYTVTNGSESGSGNYISTGAIAYWTAGGTGVLTAEVSTIPASGTTAIAASNSATTPQVLAGTATSYIAGSVTAGVGGATAAGDVAQVFKFTQSANLPAAQSEFEIIITINYAVSSQATLNVYIETQTTAPTSATIFTFYIDIGSASSSSVTINWASQNSEACTGVAGTAVCP